MRALMKAANDLNEVNVDQTFHKQLPLLENKDQMQVVCLATKYTKKKLTQGEEFTDYE